MALAVESPAREDLSFRTNDDKRVGARWVHDDLTPIVLTAATFTLEFDPPATEFDPVTGEPLPAPPPEVHEITSVTPGDPLGWFDPDGFAVGVALVQVPHDVWVNYSGR